MIGEQLTTNSRPVRVLMAASLAMFAINVDFFGLQATLPAMARDLDTTVGALQWVISAYMLALASLLIVGGRLADLLGRRKFLIIGAAIFGLASLGAGASSTPEMIVVMRIVQGAGAAILFPVCLAIVTNAFPRSQTQRAVGLVFAIAAIGQALGPLIGGVMTDWLSWRWMLWVNIPISAAIVVLAVTSIGESRDDTVPKRIDWLGLGLIVVSIATFTYGIDRGGDWGWTSPRTLSLIAIGCIGLAVFVIAESKERYPLLDLSLFRSRVFSVMTAGGAVGNMAISTTIFLSMIYLQNVKGFSALKAGTVFLTFSLAVTVVDQFVGRLERFEPRWVMAIGLAVGGGGTVGMALIGQLGAFLAFSVFSGAGLGLVFAYTSVITQAVAPQAKAGAASGVVSTILIGLGGVAIAAAAAIVGTSGEVVSELDNGVSIALAVFGGLAVVMAPVVAVLGKK
jgi:EmrB/QacA subfamily drug resistance transporter